MVENTKNNSRTATENVADLCADGLDTVGEAATFTGLSRSKLYAMMETGTLCYAKIGKCRRIPHRALVRLATSNLRGIDRGLFPARIDERGNGE
jgi:excisionase family DNA binding protein